jgi:glycosyltransferase involved in cell wall biosynthesis
VADDCSPTPLAPVVSEFAGAENERFRIRSFRAENNRGAMDNFRFCVEQAKGKFLVPLPHDNRFTDPRFFAEAVRMMATHADCHLCYGNAIYESSERRALNIPATIPVRDGWGLVEGDEFIRLYRRGGMGWSQAMVLDHEMALSIKAYDEPFVVNGAVARRLGVAQDDLFAYVFLLSGMGTVGLCERLVCEIGTPPESYSRSDTGWIKTRGKVKFFIFYNISRAAPQGRHSREVKRAAFRQALEYIECIFDRRIGQYYEWRPQIILFMGLSLFKIAGMELRFAFKRGVNLIRPNTFNKTKRL